MAFSFYMFACHQGTALKNLSPIQPPATLSNDITLTKKPERPELTMTKNDITMTISYWRRYDLNLKFNRGSTTSPFYYEEAWHQGDKVDVFYVTIKNNRKAPILFDVTNCKIVDQDKNEFGALSYEDNRKRLEYKKGHDVMIENGLEESKKILLEMSVADGKIDPGETVEGFLPFRQVKHRTKEFNVDIPIEMVPEKALARYKKIVFSFPFVHNLAIRMAQPSTIRF